MKGQLLARKDIDEATRESMYRLFRQQFDNVSYADFVEDLGQKNRVLLIRQDDGSLAAFSSMHLYKVTVDERRLSVLYSGDTVVDSGTWSDSALSYYWMGAVDRLCRQQGIEQLYWFLLVSGYRTYRFLPVYSDYFYPRHDRPMPEDIRRIMDTLARQRFGPAYDPKTGIVRLAVPSILRDDFRGIPENRLADPHIAYFANRNPGHERGDELVCLSILAEDRLTRLGRRMWSKGRRLLADSPDA